MMVTFRPHVRADIPFRIKWLNNKNANIFAVEDSEHVTNTVEQEEWFNRYDAGGKKFFTICEDDKPVGFLGLSNIDLAKKEASVFIMIGEDDCRGKGIGRQALDFLLRYAFEELGLETLTLDVDKKNQPAIGLYQSAGFEKVRDLNDEGYDGIKMQLDA